MSQTIESIYLDGGDANGTPIVVASSNPANPTVIHGGPSDAAQQDAVFLRATNRADAEAELVLIWNTKQEIDPNDEHMVVFRLPRRSTVTLVDGWRLGVSNSANFGGVRAFLTDAAQASGGLVSIIGWADRISQNPTP